MPIGALTAYIERLPARMAEYKLAMADAMSVPNMKKNDRAATLKSWQRLANVNQRPPRTASRGALKLMGIGVKSV